MGNLFLFWVTIVGLLRGREGGRMGLGGFREVNLLSFIICCRWEGDWFVV
jgi:hypothetical protein